jgi:hypothetical protein
MVGREKEATKRLGSGQVKQEEQNKLGGLFFAR